MSDQKNEFEVLQEQNSYPSHLDSNSKKEPNEFESLQRQSDPHSFLEQGEPDSRSKKPSNWTVAGHAIAEAIPATADFLANLVLGDSGSAMNQLAQGKSPVNAAPLNPAMTTLDKTGLLDTSADKNMTAGQRLLYAGTQGAAMGAATGGAGLVRSAGYVVPEIPSILSSIFGSAGVGAGSGLVAQSGAELGHPVAGAVVGTLLGGLAPGVINKAAVEGRDLLAKTPEQYATEAIQKKAEEINISPSQAGEMHAQNADQGTLADISPQFAQMAKEGLSYDGQGCCSKRPERIAGNKGISRG